MRDERGVYTDKVMMDGDRMGLLKTNLVGKGRRL